MTQSRPEGTLVERLVSRLRVGELAGLTPLPDFVTRDSCTLAYYARASDLHVLLRLGELELRQLTP